MNNQTLNCPKCNTATESKFCLNCGEKMFSHMRTQADVEYIKSLLEKAMGVMSESKDEKNMFSLVQFMMIEMILDWVTGKSDRNPVELLVNGEEDKNEKLKAIVESSKLGAKD